MTNLTALLERVREAEGADRGIDAALWWNFDPVASGRCYNNASTGLPRDLDHSKPMPEGLGNLGVRVNAPHYTASLDAAVALVERAAPDCVISLKQRFAGGTRLPWSAEIYRGGIGVAAFEDAKTPALALLAALLASLVEGS